MEIVFRVDASIEMGTGHVMRCLTLTDALRNQGATVTFVLRALAGDMTDHVLNKHNEVFCYQHPPKNFPPGMKM